MDRSVTISQAINDSFTQINDLYRKYLIAAGNIDDQQHWSNLLQQELVRHLSAERTVLHRALEKSLDEYGKDILDQEDREHARMKSFLFLLETTAGTDPQYRLMLDQLMANFNQHIARELKACLPKLESKTTPDMSRSLAISFQEAKNSSHLKVHPGSAINPPL